MTTLFFLETLVTGKPKYSSVWVLLLPPSLEARLDHALQFPLQSNLGENPSQCWKSSGSGLGPLLADCSPNDFIHKHGTLTTLYCWLQPQFLWGADSCIHLILWQFHLVTQMLWFYFYENSNFLGEKGGSIHKRQPVTCFSFMQQGYFSLFIIATQVTMWSFPNLDNDPWKFSQSYGLQFPQNLCWSESTPSPAFSCYLTSTGLP